MRLHRIVPIAFAVSTAVALSACDDRDRPTISDPPTSSVVVVEPVRLEGGSYVEGFVAGTDVDGEPDAISRMAPLVEPVRATVTPGERHVRVVVYPCNGSCPGGWDGFAARYETELAEPGEKLGRLGQFVEHCSETFEVAPGAELHITPVLDLGDVGEDGPTCEYEVEARHNQERIEEEDDPGSMPACGSGRAATILPLLHVRALEVRGSTGSHRPSASVTVDPHCGSPARPLGDRGLRATVGTGEHVMRIEVTTGPSSSVTCDERIDVGATDLLELLPVLEADSHAARCRVERRSTTGA